MNTTRKCKPSGLTLKELGMLSHIRAHLVGGKFQHKNKHTAILFDCDESSISRLITALESKGEIDVERDQDNRGVWLTQVITPKKPHAPMHEAMCACYQELEHESGGATCTGASHTTLQRSKTPNLQGSYIEGSLVLDAPVHVALAAARQRLQKAKDSRASNFDRKRDNYHSRWVHSAQQEVKRLERMAGGAA
jgi:hypothetical protein